MSKAETPKKKHIFTPFLLLFAIMDSMAAVANFFDDHYGAAAIGGGLAMACLYVYFTMEEKSE